MVVIHVTHSVLDPLRVVASVLFLHERLAVSLSKGRLQTFYLPLQELLVGLGSEKSRALTSSVFHSLPRDSSLI